MKKNEWLLTSRTVQCLVSLGYFLFIFHAFLGTHTHERCCGRSSSWKINQKYQIDCVLASCSSCKVSLANRTKKYKIKHVITQGSDDSMFDLLICYSLMTSSGCENLHLRCVTLLYLYICMNCRPNDAGHGDTTWECRHENPAGCPQMSMLVKSCWLVNIVCQSSWNLCIIYFPLNSIYWGCFYNRENRLFLYNLVSQLLFFFLEQLIALISAAKQHDVEFIYAISPGLDATFSNPKEVATLKRKLDQVGLCVQISRLYGSLRVCFGLLLYMKAVKWKQNQTSLCPLCPSGEGVWLQVLLFTVWWHRERDVSGW